MTALDQINQMKKQGRSESEIISSLKSQGINPKEISEALNQSKIKEAVYDSSGTEGMVPSIMPSGEGGTSTAPAPEPQSMYTPEPSSEPQPPASQMYSPQDQSAYPQQYGGQQMQDYGGQDAYAGYDDQSGYYDQGYAQPQSTDTMIEVAEQVFSEKIKKLTQELRELTEFKTVFETKVENIQNRLERMEKYFDKMQLQILDKVGEYGKGLDYMKKELKMVEDSMSKFSEKK